MTRWNSFGRGVAFAAVAAAGAAVWLLCIAPLAGGRTALGIYLIGVATAYVGGVAPSLRRGIGASVAVALSGLGLAVVAPGLRELIVGLAVLVGLARSGFLYRSTPARVALTEAILIVGGLWLGNAVGGASLRAVVLGVWGFFLVQSFFFLVPGERRNREFTGRPDPFEAAHGRAVAILDRSGVNV